MMLVDITLCTL